MVHPLKVYRASQSLTQKQLAEIFGVTRTTVARWETGRKIDEAWLSRVSQITGIEPSELRPDLADLLRVGR